MFKYRKDLPEKYYLDHFNEFVDFITQFCGHLLDKKHQEFVNCYQQLGHAPQCMFVRVINRQSGFINLNKMIYQEINDCPQQLLMLENVGLLSRLSLNDIKHWLPELTKIQLLDILNEYMISGVKKSASKSVLLEQLLQSCSNSECLSSQLAQQFLVKNFEP
jgi:DNA polymerase-3 subunit epsilon